LAKIPVFLSLGFAYSEHWLLLTLLVVAVIGGTFLGKKLLGRISEALFLKIFQIVLAAIAVHLIAQWAFATV
jgi:uncharacterized membrane protein YfcA